MYQHKGIGLIALGIFAILVWALLKYMWIIGIVLIVAGLIMFAIGKK